MSAGLFRLSLYPVFRGCSHQRAVSSSYTITFGMFPEPEPDLTALAIPFVKNTSCSKCHPKSVLPLRGLSICGSFFIHEYLHSSSSDDGRSDVLWVDVLALGHRCLLVIVNECPYVSVGKDGHQYRIVFPLPFHILSKEFGPPPFHKRP